MTAAAAQTNVTQFPSTSPLPAFEGQVVEYTTIKISGLSSLTGPDIEHKVISHDDRVRIVGELKATAVHFDVDKDGKLFREVTLKPTAATLCPWDPSDPDDDGIIRARPIQQP